MLIAKLEGTRDLGLGLRGCRHCRVKCENGRETNTMVCSTQLSFNLIQAAAQCTVELSLLKLGQLSIWLAAGVLIWSSSKNLLEIHTEYQLAINKLNIIVQCECGSPWTSVVGRGSRGWQFIF